MYYIIHAVRTGKWLNFGQVVEGYENFKGKTMTVSALGSGNFKIVVGAGDAGYILFIDHTGTESVISGSFVFPQSATKLVIILQSSDNNGQDYVAAKLELGTQQTLAHKDASGNWVLNDPPPNKALELLKCQRYYQTGRYAGTARNNGHFNIQFPVEMRATPAISISNVQVFASTYVDQSGKYGSNIVPTSKTNTRFKIDQSFYDGFMTAAFSWTADANL